VGQQGVSDAIASEALPMWATHAHNVPFDALVRYGVLGFALVVLVLGIAAVLGVQAARSGRGAAGIAIVTALVVGGLADTTIQWAFWVNTTYALILAALISASWPQQPASDPTQVP
jgi:O-antigen ligase